MRFEATLSEPKGKALIELAESLGLSRSQLMDEALGLFLTTALEVRRGRRLCLVDGDTRQPLMGLVTPSLAALEWSNHQHSLEVSPQEMEQLAALVQQPPAPTAALRAALRGEEP
jgi:predicted GNAT superfamily acetyltransferase